MRTAAPTQMPKYSTLVQWSNEDNAYVAICPEFEGLSGLGATAEEAIAVLGEAIEMAIEVYADEGQPLPQPRWSSEFSGQFRLRVPRHLHAALVTAAEQEGVSLNTLAVTYLSRGLGQAPERRRKP